MHLSADRVGTSVDKFGKVSSLGFAWRPIVAILIQLCARSFSLSLLPGGLILQSKGGPFLSSREEQLALTVIFRLLQWTVPLAMGLCGVGGIAEPPRVGRDLVYVAPHGARVVWRTVLQLQLVSERARVT